MMDDIEDTLQGSRREKKCDICSRSFARTEHLARHRRTHTKEKPFTCPYCRKSFQRSDVKASHVKKCRGAVPGIGDGDGDGEAREEATGRKRVRIACDSCRRRKMRCDGKTPCAPCHSSQSTCNYIASSTLISSPITTTNALQGTTRELSTESRNELDLTVDDDGGPQSHRLSTTIELSNAENEPFLHDGMDSIQPVPGQPIVRIYGSTIGDEPDLSIPNDDILYPIPETDGRVDFWQMPPMDSQFWFDGSDFSWSEGLFDTTSPISNHVFSSSMQHLTATMQEYFDRKSRAPSPSLNKASKMWYSAPPNMDDHNKDVVRVFLNIFRRHIPETFSLFKDSTLSRPSRPAYTLAMAATGGLFCAVPGSAEVAKSMYNDARRLLLADFGVRNPLDEISTSPQDRLVTVKTFILLELYGLCSGDKRSYEFVEAFHGSLIHSVQEYGNACKATGNENEQDNTQLLEALHILDCYRVIIMQRPPSLSWHHIGIFAKPNSRETRISHFYKAFNELVDGGHTSGTNGSNEFQLSTLAGLCSYLWPATHLQQNRYVGDDVLSKIPSFWKADFVELACDNWLRTIGQASNPSSLVVYHMMNIMLHANLTMLQHFAHSAAGSTARDPKKSMIAREIQSWKQGGHYKIAHWHAEGIIALVERALNASTNKAERSISTNTELRRLPYEAPHVPYSIYYATIVTWCGAVTEENTTSSTLTAQAFIARGERILSLHKVHIAQLLARVLNEIK